MNCLQFALGFWDSNRDYDIFYDADHVINLRGVNLFCGYIPLSDYGYEHILKSFEGLLLSEDVDRLRRYFEFKDGCKCCDRGE